MKVKQSEFARLMGVSAKTATIWKQRGLIVMADDLVDVGLSRASLLRNAAHDSKGYKAANRQPDAPPPARYAKPVEYGNSSNIPEEIITVVTAIDSGAEDMAVLMLRHLSPEVVRPLIDEWIITQRNAWAGEPGYDPASFFDDLPSPPIGYVRWRDHPLFNGEVLPPAHWERLVSEAKEGGQ